MKYILALLAVCVSAPAALAEEYDVMGVFCKSQDDLVKALYAGNHGVFLPDALMEYPNCKIILLHSIKTNVEFLGWVPAGILKVRVYKGYTATPVVLDDGTELPDSAGEWFFTPTGSSKIPLPTEVRQIIPT